MSGPYSFTVTVISGQKDSSLLVIGASAFLYRGWMAIHPISTNKNIKEELYLGLDIFSKRGYFTCYPATDYAVRAAKEIDINFTSHSISGSLFWIALDERGYSLAEEIMIQNGIAFDEKVYKSVRKLNLVEQPMPPYPETHAPPEFWNEVARKLILIDWKHKDVKDKEAMQALYEKYVPMTPTEQEFYSWYKLLHDNLMPWREVIGNIQSDWS